MKTGMSTKIRVDRVPEPLVETLASTIRSEVATCHAEGMSDRQIRRRLLADWEEGCGVFTEALTRAFLVAVDRELGI
jgi:hypothetical protein